MNYSIFSTKNYPTWFIKTATLLFILALSVGAKAQMSGTYTIGGVGANYSTIQAAFDALNSQGVNGPVVLELNSANSPYVEQVDIKKITGASSTNTITLEGNGSVIDARTKTNSSRRYGVRFNDVDYVTIKNLTINIKGSTYSWGVHFYRNPTYCTVDSCDIDGSYSSTSSTTQVGVLFGNSTSSTSSSSYAHHCVVKNGRISGGYYAVRLYAGFLGTGCRDNSILNNEITNFRYYGVYIYGGRAHNISGNDINRLGDRTNITTFYGVYMLYASDGFVFDGNKMHDIKPVGNSNSYYFQGYFGYFCNGTSNSPQQFTNNLIYNIENSTTQYGFRFYYCNEVKIANNTIILNDNNSGTTYGIAMREYSNQSGDVVVNNIVDVSRNSTSNKYGIYFGPYSNPATVKSNCVWTNGASNANYGAWQGTPAETLEDFQDLAAGLGENGLETNPLYRDAANADFFPTDARLNGRGQDMSLVTQDVEGTSRAGSALDIGAYKMDADFSITAFTLPNANECEGYEPEITVTIKNNSTTNYTNIPVAFAVSGYATGSVEEFAPGALNAGSTTNYTFGNSYFFRDAGDYTVTVYPINDDNVVNDSMDFDITIDPAPRASVISKGTGFDGILYRGGGVSTFDVTRAGDKVEYDISTPNTYNGADYGSTWDIDFSAETQNGTIIPMSMLSVTGATGSTDAVVTFTPDATLTDSMVLLNIAVTNMANGCDSTLTRWVFVAPTPEADFDAPNVCDGDGIPFDNKSTVSTGFITYYWEFGDATDAESTAPVHKYPNAGFFDAKLTVTSNWGYIDTITKTIEVYESPNVNFSVANACEGEDLQFTNKTTVASGTLNYTWNFGDGSPEDNTENPTHQYAGQGEYTVMLTAEANGCKRAIQKSAFQFAQPVANFSKSGGECNAEEVTLTNSSTIATGRIGSFWDLGDGVVSTEKDVLHTYEGAGIKDVTLTVTSDFGCTDDITIQVELKEAPEANFDNSQTCDLDPVEFTNTTTEPSGSNVDYSWDFGDPTSNDNTSNLTNPTHQYSLPGPRTITLLAEADNGCSNEISKDIVIGVQPSADFDVQNVCTGEDVKFNNLTTISRGDIPVTYQWDLEGSTQGTSDDISPEANFDAAGTYSITLVATSEGGCKDEITKDVTIVETPVCSFTTTTTGQLDVQFTPDVEDANNTYEWRFGDGGFSAEMNPNYQYSANLPYEVSLRIVTPEGCECESVTTSTITDVNSVEFANSVTIYPNPSNGIFNIQIDDNNTEDVELEVYNAMGVKVTSATINSSDKGDYTLDISSLPAGVYVVKLASGGNYTTQRITVSH